MIKAEYNPYNYTYNVTISEDELLHVFKAPNAQEYRKLIHGIVSSCYGEEFADKVFPMQGGETENE